MPFFTTNGGVEQFHCESPTKDLMRVLVEKTEAAGRILTSEEFAKYPELPKPNHFAYYFGSFSEAAKQAYAKTEHYKNAKMREKLEPKKAYQEAEVRQILVDFYKKRRYLPSVSQLDKGRFGEMPPLAVVQQFFGKTRRDWMNEIIKDFRTEETPPEPRIEETLPTEETPPEPHTEETLSVEEETPAEEPIIEEEETPAEDLNIEEIQVKKHESDSGEVTIEVTINLPSLKKPIKILIPA